MKWFIKCLQNYANFKGRARRKEYWYFVLFYLLISIPVLALQFAIFGLDKPPILVWVLSLAFFLPSLAVQVRRLHDTGRSGKLILWNYLAAVGWYIITLISLVPWLLKYFQSGSAMADSLPIVPMIILGLGLVGFTVWGIFFLVWYCTAGTKGENKYGPDPKEIEE